MREIKFRGRKPNGEWLYGDLVTTETTDGIPTKKEILPFDKAIFDATEEVEEYTIGQFTGLHDKNGKEIYEGDIIRGNCGRGEVRHLISFYDMTASFVAEILPDTDINDYCTASQIWILKYSKEVLGNIHDNPELLNK